MENKLKELKENLYDAISGGYMEINIGEFKIIAYEITSLKPIEKSTFIVVVCKIAGCDIFDYTKYIFRKEYDISVKPGWFFTLIFEKTTSVTKFFCVKTKLVDKIMEELTPIVAISVLREQKLKKLGI
jgi:hypothetical protein